MEPDTPPEEIEHAELMSMLENWLTWHCEANEAQIQTILEAFDTAHQRLFAESEEGPSRRPE